MSDDNSGLTTAQATLLAAVSSLLSAILVAFITGSFDTDTKKIERIKDETVEAIKQEGSARVEEVRQLTAKVSEEAKSDGSIKIEKFKLQRDLILDAIKTSDREEAKKRLNFFAMTGLIPDYEKQVLKFTSNEPLNNIPNLSTTSSRKLPPLGETHLEVASSLVALFLPLNTTTIRGNFLCAGIAIKKDEILVSKHCVQEDLSSKLRIGQIGLNSLEKVSSIVSTKTIETKGPQKKVQDLIIASVAPKELQYLANLHIRRPDIGERVYIVGFARSEDVGFRGVRVMPEWRPFVQENCVVINIDEDNGFISTNCFTTAGTSGSPIIAERDGALISVVSWGADESETNGPILNEFRNLIEGRSNDH